MGRRSRNDAIDTLGQAWGRQRRVLLGLSEPKLAREYVGSLTCTLGRIRQLHDGAGSGASRRDQKFPEVYTGDAFLVNLAYKAMAPDKRAVMDVHYAVRAPIPMKADSLALSVDTYWRRVQAVREFLRGYLARFDEK